MLEELLPRPAVCAETFTDPAGPPVLFPEEEAVVAGAVDRRRREFATVRRCARTALAALGVAPGPILPGRLRAPVWPEGVVGSMTHCEGYRAAAVARAAEVVTLGIDAEPHEPLPGREPDVVARPEERERLAGLRARWPEVCWDRLLFSVKECVYKAWFPVTGRWLGFEEASVVLESAALPSVTLESSASESAGPGPGTGIFRAALLVPGPVAAGVRLTGFEGRWLVRDGLVLTAVAVPVRAAGHGGEAPESSRAEAQPPHSRSHRPHPSVHNHHAAEPGQALGRPSLAAMPSRRLSRPNSKRACSSSCGAPSRT
jgi:4'-phosphopantetheinyl transferase EntD